MGRAPCCDKANVKKGPWSPEEDSKLKDYIHKFGTGGNWIALPHKAGLKRCGKSCRLRWLNYLRPNIKHGEFSDEEDTLILNLFATIGSRWSIIASQLPGRTDNDIKNYWNTKLKKKLISMMVPPQNHPIIQPSSLIQFPSSTYHHYQNLPLLMSCPPLSSFCRDNNSYPFYTSNISIDPTKPLTTGLDFLSSIPPKDLPRSSNQSTASEMFQNQEGSSVIPVLQIIKGSSSSSSSSSASSRKLDHQTLSVFSDTIIKQEIRSSDIDYDQNQISNGFEQISQTPNLQWQEISALLQEETDDHLEDVKRLIGSSNSASHGNSNFFCSDDEQSRLEEMSMYYF